MTALSLTFPSSSFRINFIFIFVYNAIPSNGDGSPADSNFAALLAVGCCRAASVSEHRIPFSENAKKKLGRAMALKARAAKRNAENIKEMLFCSWRAAVATRANIRGIEGDLAITASFRP